MNSLQLLYFAAFPLLLAFTGSAPDDRAGKLEDALATPVSLKIDRSSLVECLNALTKKLNAEHPGFKIAIIGQDLQSEGITRNQSIRDYEAVDKPAVEVLTELLGRANPDRDAKPGDPQFKLIWIVGAHPDNAEKLAILITTRAAADKRGDKIPKIFHRSN